ncbi:hypothetical protein FACS189483_06650 [Spirochaetia bacterium]|nr:hypothetical protein FACS189483_06650 [Spirochaetia bacterium]
MTLPLIFSAASVILWGFSFLFFLNYLKRRTGQERILAEFRDEIDQLLAEIDEVTDRDQALVEERIKTLRALLDDTDRRIAVYAREVDRRRAQEDAYAEFGRLRPPGGDPSQSQEWEDADRGTSAGRDLPDMPIPVAPLTQGNLSPVPASPLSQSTTQGRAADSPVTPLPAQSPSAAAPAALDGRYPRIVRSKQAITPKPLPFAERVGELYRAGFSANLIAAQLGATLTEVELAIALIERRGLNGTP